ncbi:hypothetical protein [Candidatus Lokiarchaeum ossiferum]|uniref:hypothetical protein n=1 Tax=Candidatus Lokiarchaeum ossiferum TaxID=2951803 RepID=UPI00352F1548
MKFEEFNFEFDQLITKNGRMRKCRSTYMDITWPKPLKTCAGGQPKRYKVEIMFWKLCMDSIVDRSYKLISLRMPSSRKCNELESKFSMTPRRPTRGSQCLQ